MTARATPLDVDGAPFRVETDAIRALAAGAHPDAVAGGWPAVGGVQRRAGRALREVTFLAEDVPEGHDAMVHLNGLTDGHRTDIRPALLRPVPGTRHRALGYLLPDGLELSYRLVVARELPIDAGRTREGWLRVHRLGRPDPRNPDRIPDPLGETSSVLRMPGSRRHAVWDADAPKLSPGRARTAVTAAGLELTVWEPDADAVGLLVLFDGERWRGIGALDAFARWGGSPRRVVFVPAGTNAQRAAVLPHPARVSALLAHDVLPAVGCTDPASVIVAGQSYGGLAAAAVVATRPDLAATAIVQSGSFHFRPDAPPRPPAGQRGELLDALIGVRVPGRFLIQVGSEERDMVTGAEAFRAAAVAGGAEAGLVRYAGGHDYAWWRTGLFDALDAVDPGSTSPQDVPE
ncbi:enterochelin esterase domain-containing protein [Protaetiibacter larvae]|uniref:DUF3327 domain-containing protein n=1 Tax=Protaetiibacter larvae TaxID=2592654 RepID=A0A5C1YAF5_9MICO|nr:enterochelin esterase domain-containing protein [Protaetiibacter larvae]QEO10580.1 DUF3327 domain-containing protein [Protaetiibacter larvae]